MLITLSKKFTFEASHVLPKHPGKCSRLHGHSWGLIVTVRGQIDKETGFVVDYGDLSECVKFNIIDKLDHQHLGQGTAVTGGTYNESGSVICLPPFGINFYPSSENLVAAIARILQVHIREIKHGLELIEVELAETCTCAAKWSVADSGGTYSTSVE